MTEPFVVGAVAYAPKVVTIWEGFRDWLAERDFALDYLLYPTYDRQVEDLLDGRCSIGWNSPLAFIRARRLAEASGREIVPSLMRDTDQGLNSVVVVRTDSGITELDALRGRTVGVGDLDSPQSHLIPMGHLADHGLVGDVDLGVVPYGAAPGKHGDVLTGERSAFEAMLRGEVAAACVIGGSLLTFASEGLGVPGEVRVLTETPAYDHCIFTAVSGLVDPEMLSRFESHLMSMSIHDPSVRMLLELEGLREWRPGRTDGFDLLDRAVDRFGPYDAAGRLAD